MKKIMMQRLTKRNTSGKEVEGNYTLPNTNNQPTLTYPIRKTIRQEDLNFLNCFALPYEQVKKHVIPQLKKEELKILKEENSSINIIVKDEDTREAFDTMKLKRRGKNYGLMGPWMFNFVNRRSLNIGQQIGFEYKNEIWHFSVIKR
ncbi:B3 domain-containing protein At2g33720-like [Fagus crenata]